MSYPHGVQVDNIQTVNIYLDHRREVNTSKYLTKEDRNTRASCSQHLDNKNKSPERNAPHKTFLENLKKGLKELQKRLQVVEEVVWENRLSW